MNRKTLLITIAVFCAGIASGEVFKPSHKANLWKDDYSEFGTLADSARWGTYNVHDPACRLIGDTYYMYSTDAIYWSRSARGQRRMQPKTGFLQMRRSKDLVNWEFLGWAFDSIPDEPKQWVKSLNNGHGATNIWAPYMVPAPDGKSFRLYYCVSAFGKKTSMISMATAPHPEGPWKHSGCVIRTDYQSPVNAIDPTVTDVIDGRQWMIYGSFFGGLYCVELDPATGLTLSDGDMGHVVARRANYQKDNLEAPELLHANGRYYLFGSYDPLESTYNVRVARCKSPDGPFVDFFGKEMADTTDNYPIITAPYTFEGHSGWAGTGHCGVFADDKGNHYMCHQGRLAPHNRLMDLHLRRIYFTPDGWPVVSPERYAGTPERAFSDADLAGVWEIIRVREPQANPNNISETMTLAPEGRLNDTDRWEYDAEAQMLTLVIDGERISHLMVHSGHDWEREQDTVLFTGLDSQGRSVWGKRVK